MACPIYDESPDLLMDYAAGKLDWESKVQVERHLQKCELCSQALDAQTMVWKALDEWDAAPVSRDFDARLYQRIEREHSSIWAQFKSALFPGSGWLRWQPALGAATAAALILGVFLARGPNAPDPSNGAVKVESHEIEQAERALEDVDMVNKLFVDGTNEAQAL